MMSTLTGCSLRVHNPVTQYDHFLRSPLSREEIERRFSQRCENVESDTEDEADFPGWRVMTFREGIGLVLILHPVFVAQMIDEITQEVEGWEVASC